MTTVFNPLGDIYSLKTCKVVRVTGSGLLQQTRYQRTVPQKLQVPHKPLKLVKGKLDATRESMALGADYSSRHGAYYGSCLIAWDQHLYASVSG
ncbi:MAG: hypothetical protein STSR0007_03570 [Thermovirga sp.]